MGISHDKDFIYFFLADVDGYIEHSSAEENYGTKCVVFTPKEKNKETLKNYRKTLRRN